MGWFTKSLDDEIDQHRRRAERRERRDERREALRDFRGLSAGEASKVVTKAVGRRTGRAAISASKSIISGSGKILNRGAIASIGVKLNEKRCPGCQKGMPRAGYYCPPCARRVHSSLKNAQQLIQERNRDTRDGQNKHGLVYWPEGHPRAGQRCFPNEYGALDAWLERHGR